MTTQLDPNDPYLITPESHKSYSETVAGTGVSYPKTNWHTLPPGNATSEWRILPFYVPAENIRDFYFMVRKHYKIPGLKGSLVCPRSFDDPANPGKKYFCHICNSFFEYKKSTDLALQAIAPQLRSTSVYYANAVDVEHPEKGVGVLTLPYQVYQTLDSWVVTPKSPYLTFTHPKVGRNVIITSKVMAGTKIPGTDNEKREYSTMPAPNAEPLADMSWLEQCYDLRTVVGIPTSEFTQVCLDRIINNDESFALPEGVKAYRERLALPGVEEEQQSADAVPPTVVEAVPVQTVLVAEQPPVVPASTTTVPPTFTAASTASPSSGMSEADVRAMFDKIMNSKK